VKSAIALDSRIEVDGIIGHTPALRDTLERLRRVAPTDAPVLITGETGTGKELMAQAIHRRSRRASRSMVVAHLAAVPDGLVGTELFGHERGAFTGADRMRIGRFEAADRGTLFLDEVGELSGDMQVALLRALQDGDFERVGANSTRRADVRIVAATNRDLEQAMDDGRFRPDLFYRLGVFPIHLPPLRERRDDIPVLAEHFLHRSASKLGRSFAGIERASVSRLTAYHWPGNIRQLQNVIEHSAILCDDDELHVPEDVLTRGRGETRQSPAAVFADTPSLEEIKKRYIRHLVTTTNGNMSKTAEILDVDRRSLYRMMDRYHIPLPQRNVNSDASAVVHFPSLRGDMADDCMPAEVGA